MGRIILAILVAAINFAFLSYNAGRATEAPMKKSEQSRTAFVEAQVLLMEGKHDEAYSKAEELISRFAGDRQISLYVLFYTRTFYALDESWRQGQLRPLPAGIRARIEKIIETKEKSVLDLVKLARLDPEHSRPYLRELLTRFPQSVWKDWAEWKLLEAKAFELQEEYSNRDSRERLALVLQELYKLGKQFVDEHPDSYMLPCALDAVSMWKAYFSKGKETDNEIVALCRRILCDYPDAEYYCACARQRLRLRLGRDCPEVQGFSAEDDRTIRKFYCAPYHKVVGRVKDYLDFKKRR